jgi:anti-sigma B factor antagonist
MTPGSPVRVEPLEKFGVTVAVLQGPKLDAEIAGDLRLALMQLIDRGHRKLILDLAAIDFIDSSGLGALVSALKRLKHLDGTGEIRLANVRPSVRAVLEIIRLHRVFPQFSTVDDAVHSFKATA